MGIFDLKGPEFLQFYLICMAIAIVPGIIWRRAMLGSFGGTVDGPPLDAFEAAYLSGGRSGLGNAVLASLIQRKIASFTGNGQIAITGGPAADLHPIERKTLERMRLNDRYSLRQFRDCVESDALTRSLEERNLAPDASQQWNAAVAPIAIMLLLLVTGLIKIGVGINRDKPVAFLVMLSVVTAIILALFCRPARRTAQGSRALRTMRERNATLRSTATSSTATLSAFDVALALALWGPGTLSGSDYAALRTALMPSGGDGSGGSSCGGGGCGGGGCGGCGGG